MRRLGRIGILILVGCASTWACNSFSGDDPRPSAGIDGGGSATDASSSGSSEASTALGDASAKRCSPTAKFGPRTRLEIGAYADIGGVRFSDDELTAYFWNRQGPKGGSPPYILNYDLYQAHRASKDEAFGAIKPFGTLNTIADEAFPTVTKDGLTMYFHRGGTDARKLFMATRASVDADFGDAAGLLLSLAGALPAPDDSNAWLAADGTSLFFSSHGRPDTVDDVDIFRIELPSTTTTAYEPFPKLHSDFVESSPVLTADGLTIYFKSNRLTQHGDIMVARRANEGTDFDAPTPVAELNSADENEAPTWISPDGCVIYFAVEGDVTYMATRGL